jgi:hypothetical protein
MLCWGDCRHAGFVENMLERITCEFVANSHRQDTAMVTVKASDEGWQEISGGCEKMITKLGLRPAEESAGDDTRPPHVPQYFDDHPYPGLLKNINSNREQGQNKRSNELNLGDRTNVSRLIEKLRKAGLPNEPENSHVFTLSEKGRQYLNYLELCGKV